MQAGEAIGAKVAEVKGMDFDLVHVRFSFDRTRMSRMHATLHLVAQDPGLKLLPPDKSTQV